MSNHPVGDGREDRPPSARARAELSAGVASSVADARLRLQEAVLRAEGHRLLGDETGLQAALKDQDHILADLQDRLGRTASAAVLQRDAEEVVAAAVADVGDLDIATSDDVRVVTLDDQSVPAAPRRAPVLSGVASVVALVALAGAIVLGTGQGPTSPGLLEIAGQLDEVERQDAPADPATSPVPDTAPGGTTDRSADPTAAPAGPTERARTTDAPATEQAAEPGDDSDARTLERIVEELHEVVNRFGLDPSARTDLPVVGDEDGQQAEDGDPGDQDGTDGDATDADDADGDAADGDDGDDEDDEEGRRWLDGFSRDGDGE
jgi:hypothetical protein